MKKDLLDAYQSRLLDALNDAEAADKRDFQPRRAEEAAQAAGYWRILAAEHRRQLGAEASESAAAAFAALDREAAAGGPRFEAALADAREILHGFTAAPFTAAEQARRATQLVRFLDLVPVEYGRGVEGRRVTKRSRSRRRSPSATAPSPPSRTSKAALTRRDERDARIVARSLEQLAGDGRGREHRRQGRHEGRDRGGRTSAPRPRSTGPCRRAGSSRRTESDFDLIDLTLDRVDAAVAAGEWKQAEQARLEAYAFFEFGPELRLKAFDPQLSADVEGLVWFGARGEKGMASLISRPRARGPVPPPRGPSSTRRSSRRRRRSATRAARSRWPSTPR